MKQHIFSTKAIAVFFNGNYNSIYAKFSRKVNYSLIHGRI
jgi:hypothetical protein